jgi:hypothetical protein
VYKYLNMNPLHKQALPVVVVFMCKSKHCPEIALSYLQACVCEELPVSSRKLFAATDL